MSNTYSFHCIGCISGSSLDGLDIALVNLDIDPSKSNPIINWSLESGKTIPFSSELVNELKALPKGAALDLIQVDDRLGKFMGQAILDFMGDQKIDFVSSHGHTIFHHPGSSSTQIGNAAMIAAITGTKTVGHLRNMDTAYGGQGAPIAPMADLYLWPEHDVCINLGGIANISLKSAEGILGFDVCGANQLLNHLANRLGYPYDDQGNHARSGQLDPALLNRLNDLEYCQLPIPKSLDNEQVKSMYLSILDHSKTSTLDQITTMTEHIAYQLSRYIQADHRSILLAGGGTHNTFLVERLSTVIPRQTSIVIPDDDVINFKEALLIAMCGALRLLELPNVHKSITGAAKNTSNGVVFLP